VAHRTVQCTTGQSGAPPDSHCLCSVRDFLPFLAQLTVATPGWLVHQIVRCPQPTVGTGHASPADFVADRCTGGRWLTGQSGAPPDSPVNYSRTPPSSRAASSLEASLAHRTLSGAPSDIVRCTTGQSGVPDRAESWLLRPSPFLLLFSLILALRQIY
jgi:hypothetical protein